MNASELYSLRQRLLESKTLLCFNGPISRSLIEEFGHALKRYLEMDQVRPSEAMDVFSVYIEVTQNIRHYTGLRAYNDEESAATVVICRENGHYVVSAGNLVEWEDGQELVSRINQLGQLDKAQLKAAYKTQLRQPRDSQHPDSAGLGLIEIARRATAPLQATLSPLSAERAFFSLSVVI